MSGSPVHVLLVEDNPNDARLIVELLREAGDHGLEATATCAQRLGDALALLGRQHFDAILLDLWLPDSTGRQTLERAVAGARGVPVIVLTGIEDADLARQAVQGGAEDYLLKGDAVLDHPRLFARTIQHGIERRRARASLRAADERYRLLWDAGPMSRLLFDVDTLRILEVNAAATREYGYSPEEFLSLRVTELRAAEDVSELLETLADAPDDLTDFGPVRHRRRDGSTFDAEIAAATIRYQGRRARLIAVHDVTARRQATARTEQLLAVTAALTDASTPEEVAQRIATRVVEALGASAASVAVVEPGEDEVHLLGGANLPPEFAERWRRFPVSAESLLAEAIRTGEPSWLCSPREVAGSAPMPMPDGEHPAGACVALPLVSGEHVIGAVGISFADGREFAPQDREVLLAIARQCALAVERARLFAAQRRASESARAASDAKSQFLAVMSHELRTPLTAILGFAELMSEGVAGPVTSQQLGYLERVRRSAKHLLVLINDVLMLSRIEAERQPTDEEPVLVPDLVAEAVALLEPSARAKEIAVAVECSEPVLVRTDASKVRQILINLLANAVKFTERGGVHVRIARTNGELHVEVRDTGVGIAPEHLASIFEPFWQVNQELTRRVGGTGLGLNVSLRLARLLGGDLHVRSTPGTGTTFTLVLPGAYVSGAVRDHAAGLEHRPFVEPDAAAPRPSAYSPLPGDPSSPRQLPENRAR